MDPLEKNVVSQAGDTGMFPDLGIGMIFGGMTAGTLLLAGVDWIKRSARNIIGFFFISVTVKDQNVAAMIVKYFRENYIVLSMPERVYGTVGEYVKSKKRRETISYRDLSVQSVYLKNKIFPVFVGANTNKNGDESSSSGVNFSFIRGVINADKLVEECTRRINEEKHGSSEESESNKRFRIIKVVGPSNTVAPNDDKAKEDEGSYSYERITFFRRKLLGYKESDLGQASEYVDPFKNLAFNKSIDEIVKICVEWKNSKEWFIKRGVPWKMGLLLHGPPGTGKTAFARALGELLDFRLYQIDLSTMNNPYFIGEWKEICEETPAIALIEDIDGVFHGRKNVAETGLGRDKLTFDCLINQIDGVENSDGVLTIITTNDISKVDEAIGVDENGDPARPGRVDKVLNFPYLQLGEKEKIAARILIGYDKEKEAFLKKHQDSKDTGSQFQSKCVQEAQKVYWKEKA